MPPTWTPPPPSLSDQSGHRGKNEICRWENLVRPFLVHKLLGPSPPPPPPFEHFPDLPTWGAQKARGQASRPKQSTAPLIRMPDTIFAA